jgi:hypothetical protein
MRYPLALLVLGAAALFAHAAAAQGTDAAAATALFKEGRDAAKNGDYATACLKFEESLRLDFGVGTLLNLADCHEHRGHVATAWQMFQQAADQSAPTDKRRATAQERVAALEGRLPRLAVTVAPGAPPDTTVVRDGVLLGKASLGTALPVDPGDHVILAKAPDRAEGRFPIVAVEGQTVRVVVAPGAPPASAPSHAPSSLRIAGIVVAGAGVALLAAAVATGLVLPSKGRITDQQCGTAADLPTDTCTPAGFAAAQSGKTLLAANTGTWIAGGIAAATGLTLVIVDLAHRDAPATAVTLGSGQGFIGAALHGRFQ